MRWYFSLSCSANPVKPDPVRCEKLLCVLSPVEAVRRTDQRINKVEGRTLFQVGPRDFYPSLARLDPKPVAVNKRHAFRVFARFFVQLRRHCHSCAPSECSMRLHILDDVETFVIFFGDANLVDAALEQRLVASGDTSQVQNGAVNDGGLFSLPPFFQLRGVFFEQLVGFRIMPRCLFGVF